MTFSDFLSVLNWWAVLFFIGAVFLPLTTVLFTNFFDKGYIFAKVLGVGIVSYVIFLLGTLHILPFTQPAIFLVLAIFLVINIFLVKVRPSLRSDLKSCWKIFAFEELLFFAALLFWSFIRAHEPSIHGLEKYMDFGFVNSILRTDYFPPKDMWYPPLPINYYYFGHLITAVLTKLSGIDSLITYNLMMATLFALTFTGTFSIGTNLWALRNLKAGDASRGAPGGGPALVRAVGNAWGWRAAGPALTGLLTAFLVTMAGNLHTIYTFFKPYLTENPLPFWQLPFSPQSFPNSYWYPNATRFIENTIHEFPIYSFVVSDLHGHVLDIPVVLLVIAVLLSIISKHEYRSTKQYENSKNLNSKHFSYLNLFRISNFEFRLLLLAFLLAVMYMTNVWDALIYGGLTFFVFAYLAYKSKNYTLYAIRYTLMIAGAIILALPFSLYFKPFVSGVGVICAPEFLTNIGKLGPFLFEPNHCQRSPLWQLMILYGFFYFFVVLFLKDVILRPKAEGSRFFANAQNDIFVILLILLSTLLIIVPEFVYAKDIYPAHYRANTMFKLGYSAFIMLSLVSGYVIVRMVSSIKHEVLSINQKILTTCYILLATSLFLLVSIYPYFAINSYYGNLQTYHGLDGLSYFKNLYPSDYQAILWLNKNVKGQPVILEANGESYTDYARISSNTGLPTVIGWPVHEWLWRGSYDVAAPRITDVKTIYETVDASLAKQLLNKYHVSLIFMGDLERQKYPNLFEQKFQQLGKIIYSSGQTKIYQVTEF